MKSQTAKHFLAVFIALAACMCACGLPTSTPTPAAEAPSDTPVPTLEWTASAPTLSATPAAPVSDFPPFTFAAPIPTGLTGQKNQLVWGPNSTLWLLTGTSAAFYQGGVWTPFVSGLDKTLLGLDPSGRLWAAAADGQAIQAYDGKQWRVYGAAAGWSPIKNYEMLAVLPGLVSDTGGGLWVRTAQDVRRFDGTGWTVFSRADLGFDAPASEDSYPVFQLVPGAQGEMWAGVCDYSGPGPIGGSGLRRFDGQRWGASGANEPAKCTNLMRADAQGGIWAGVGADLWHKPAGGAWKQIPAPAITNLPEGTRMGYAVDLVFDPQGSAYALYALCGGASCDTAEVWLRLNPDGQYQQVGDPHPSAAQSLLFDSQGTPWLVGTPGQISVLTGELTHELAGFNTLAGVSDPSGKLWIAAVVNGQAELWTLEKR